MRTTPLIPEKAAPERSWIILRNVDSTGRKLLFSRENILYCLNNITKTVYEIEIVEKSFQNYYYKDQFLAIFTNQQIKNYKIKLP